MIILFNKTNTQKGFIDVISAITLALLLVGVGATTYLAQHPQDTRKYAMVDQGENDSGNSGTTGDNGSNSVSCENPDGCPVNTDQGSGDQNGGSSGQLQRMEKKMDQQDAKDEKQFQDAAAAEAKKAEQAAKDAADAEAAAKAHNQQLSDNPELISARNAEQNNTNQTGTSGSFDLANPPSNVSLAPGTMFYTDPATGLTSIVNVDTSNLFTNPNAPNYIQYTTNPQTGQVEATLPNSPVTQLYRTDPATGIKYIDPSQYGDYWALTGGPRLGDTYQLASDIQTGRASPDTILSAGLFIIPPIVASSEVWVPVVAAGGTELIYSASTIYTQIGTNIATAVFADRVIKTGVGVLDCVITKNCEETSHTGDSNTVKMSPYADPLKAIVNLPGDVTYIAKHGSSIANAIGSAVGPPIIQAGANSLRQSESTGAIPAPVASSYQRNVSATPVAPPAYTQPIGQSIAYNNQPQPVPSSSLLLNLPIAAPSQTLIANH